MACAIALVNAANLVHIGYILRAIFLETMMAYMIILALVVIVLVDLFMTSRRKRKRLLREASRRERHLKAQANWEQTGQNR
jgi:heme exporter protein D